MYSPCTLPGRGWALRLKAAGIGWGGTALNPRAQHTHTTRHTTCQPLPSPALATLPLAAACLEEQHLTDTKLRAAFEFFDRDATGRITQEDVVQVGAEHLVCRTACRAAACAGTVPAPVPAPVLRCLSCHLMCCAACCARLPAGCPQALGLCD